MQNSVLVEEGAYPSIESSWGYHWVAKPIFMTTKKIETVISLNVVERSFNR